MSDDEVKRRMFLTVIAERSLFDCGLGYLGAVTLLFDHCDPRKGYLGFSINEASSDGQWRIEYIISVELSSTELNDDQIEREIRQKLPAGRKALWAKIADLANKKADPNKPNQ